MQENKQTKNLLIIVINYKQLNELILVEATILCLRISVFFRIR